MRTSSETHRGAKAAFLRNPTNGHAAAGAAPAVHVSQATQLVDIALKQCELHHTADGTPFSVMEVGGHLETWRIWSTGFRNWLVGQFYRKGKRPPGSQALQDAITTIEAMARYSAGERALHLRVAQVEDRLYVDLCDAAWSVIEITPTGWRVLERSPVAFRRAKAMLPLPAPVRGDLEQLRGLLASFGFVVTCATSAKGRPLCFRRLRCRGSVSVFR